MYKLPNAIFLQWFHSDFSKKYSLSLFLYVYINFMQQNGHDIFLILILFVCHHNNDFVCLLILLWLTP